MIPAHYWSGSSQADTEQWLDSVHEKFRFYLQCDVSMLDDMAMQACLERLTILQPQLAALVYLGDDKVLGKGEIAGFESLSQSFDCDLVGINLSSGGKAVWRQGAQVAAASPSNFAYLESELTDLRAVRAVFDEFIQQLDSGPQTATIPASDALQASPGQPDEACIIVDHPRLQARDVSAARAVLEIMGH